MKFHYIDNNNNSMAVSELQFGKSLEPIKSAPAKAHYVTIDGSELMAAHMAEKSLIDYINAIRRSILVGGKVYLEIANYED